MKHEEILNKLENVLDVTIENYKSYGEVEYLPHIIEISKVLLLETHMAEMEEAINMVDDITED